jgi:hypothetical protein
MLRLQFARKSQHVLSSLTVQDTNLSASARDRLVQSGVQNRKALLHDVPELFFALAIPFNPGYTIQF